MLYDKRNKELLEKDTVTLKKLEKETDDFIKEQIKLLKQAYERYNSISELENQSNELEMKSTAFSRSVKKTSKKLKDKYYRTLFMILFVVLVVFSIGYFTNK
ncbi:hypothetical protein TUBRATIS_001290 [Tubulinosema ratisbonensis]|uniref:V-SNARE coiled-coil homology domain-containing protein n=1 Tax=Tubulinosema ratisbonensis TaxID=291195 RepID=A0A437AQB0_9MICR|nr:hypothetical protein TUBRATIS_001290 [Tubulinosema ratisbonensis]